MPELIEPLTRLVVHIHYRQDGVWVDHDLMEDEVPMSVEQQDAYKQIIGDGQAKVTVSKELSEADYGNGGKVFVSVTLTCDQSATGLTSGLTWAKWLADNKVWEAHAEMKAQLLQKGILR
jgi:hypothetical protein